MKIGILTLPLHTNYGGILQAWALQTVLERMGHEVFVLNKKRIYVPSKIKLYLKYLIRSILKYIFRRDVIVRAEECRLHNYKVLSTHTQQFIDKYIHSYYVDRLDELNNSNFNVDAIVVGSDQIWRPKYIKSTLRDSIPNAFLLFAKKWKIKRLSYAASLGVDEWEFTQQETKRIKNLIKLFDFVSLREESGVKLFKYNLDVDALHVLDPTMLLDKQDYELLISSNSQVKSNKNILMNYVLDETPDISELIEKIAIERNLIPYKMEVSDKADGKMIQPHVEQWLKSFQDADFVITDSFHACVFSILFQKPFVVIGNKKRGYGRFYSLMQMFNLKDNLILDPKEYDSKKNYKIHENAYDILKEKRMFSKKNIEKCLNDYLK